MSTLRQTLPMTEATQAQAHPSPPQDFHLSLKISFGRT